MIYFYDESIFKCNPYKIVKEEFPESNILGCSTSSPVMDDDIYEECITGIAFSFEHTKLEYFSTECSDIDQSYQSGLTLSKALLKNDLKHVFVISDGLTINGDKLIRGINDILPHHVGVSGGMASGIFEHNTRIDWVK